MGVRAGIYVRISMDKQMGTEAEGRGVARQEKECRRYAKRKGWEVAEVYTDNDVSATSRKPRPAYQRMLADLKSGYINGVVVWAIDRLTRRPIEMEQFMELADSHSVALGAVTGDIDLSSEYGRMYARVMGAVARMEIAKKSERQRAEQVQRASEGRRNGGPRPFGYNVPPVKDKDAKVSIREDEAAIAREVCKRLLAGEATGSVVKDLHRRGVVSSFGNPFTYITLQTMMARASLSGRREHIPTSSHVGKRRPLIGEIVSETCDYPAILDPAEHDRLRMLLTDTSRATGTKRARTLLSGILVCGRCGMAMVSRPKYRVPYYQCVYRPGRGGCQGVQIMGEPMDAFISGALLDECASEGFLDRLRARDEVDPAVVARMAETEKMLEELAAMWSNREITKAEWEIARKPLKESLERDAALVKRTEASRALAFVDGPAKEIGKRWEALNPAQKRAAIKAAIERIVVHPVATRGKGIEQRCEDPVYLV